ncbi:MAG: hypothetical protein J7K30_02880 [Deltaproteobacteria bacterium]|nr:hypothetical protein [Deltaproteobacteria bacterium]
MPGIKKAMIIKDYPDFCPAVSAAMVGAVSLCDGDSEGVARQVAIENGLPGMSHNRKNYFI